MGAQCFSIKAGILSRPVGFFVSIVSSSLTTPLLVISWEGGYRLFDMFCVGSFLT